MGVGSFLLNDDVNPDIAALQASVTALSGSVRAGVVQRQTAKGWRKVATVRSDRWGVFTATFAARGNATYRALVVRGASSLPYFSARIPARRTHAFNFG